MPEERKFRARNMTEAMEAVKRALGPDAAILRSRSTIYRDERGRVQRGVEIVVSATDCPPAAIRKPSQNNTPGAIADRRSFGSGTVRAAAPPVPEDLPLHARDYYVRLVQNEVADELARQLVTAAAHAVRQRHGGASIRTGSDGRIMFPSATENEAGALLHLLRDSIARMVPSSGGIALTPGKTRCVCLVGPPGGGKTTTLAKLAAHFKLRERANVAAISLDMNRLGATDQLRKYAEIVGISLYAAQTVEAVHQAITQCASSDLILIDTPGVSLRDNARFARLAALVRAARPDEIHLVLPAVLSASAQSRAAERFAPLGADRLLLTCLDEAAGLGVVLTAIQRIPWHISYIAVGQKVPSDLQEASGARLAEMLVT